MTKNNGWSRYCCSHDHCRHDIEDDQADTLNNGQRFISDVLILCWHVEGGLVRVNDLMPGSTLNSSQDNVRLEVEHLVQFDQI